MNRRIIRYFDIGSYHGTIPQTIIGILGNNYKAYLFEPCKKHFSTLSDKFFDNESVKLYNIALTNKKGKCPLYYSTISGHSLHRDKINVDVSNFEMVDCDVFSEWYKKEKIRKYKGDIFILRIDIEGSEYEVYTDIIESGLYKKIDLFCGSLNDLYKLKNKSKEEAIQFQMKLSGYGINVIPINSHTAFSDVEKINEKLFNLF